MNPVPAHARPAKRMIVLWRISVAPACRLLSGLFGEEEFLPTGRNISS
jgi:hypothetical protein